MIAFLDFKIKTGAERDADTGTERGRDTGTEMIYLQALREKSFPRQSPMTLVGQDQNLDIPARPDDAADDSLNRPNKRQQE